MKIGRTLANKKRRGLSPLLATVILLGVTVAAGGAVYSIYTGSSAAVSSSNVIKVDSATAVKGSQHADFAITVTNAGTNPWKAIEVWVGKEATGRPILYEELHEMVTGLGETGNTDNPLRAEAIGTLSDGFGVGIGRKFVLKIDEDADATKGAPASRKVAIEAPNFTVGTDVLQKLDAKFKGGAAGDCVSEDPDGAGPLTTDTVCNIRTTKALASPIGPGQSMRFYADLLLKDTLSSTTQTGLDIRVSEQLKPTFVTVGDELVVNIKVVTVDGEEAQMQTVVKVTGV